MQERDLRFVNQETVMAGTDEYGYAGYPSFNTPDAAADALAKTGFNLVNLATNHVLDYGVEAAERSLDVWDAYPGIACAGSYRSQADRETVRLVERNGMTFAFLAFCYGDNYFQEDLPDTWHLCGFDKAAIEADVRRAQQVADAVIVAMHWGTEYESEPDGQQLDYAAFLADLDVDLVLGTHAHTVQPVRLVQGASGNAVPVVFGLGDLVSGWGKVDYILSGLFTCDFVRVYDEAGTDGGSGDAGTDGAEGVAGSSGDADAAADDAAARAAAAAAAGAAWHVEVRNLAWHPTMEWSDGGPVRVRFLADMDEATTNANVRAQEAQLRPAEHGGREPVRLCAREDGRHRHGDPGRVVRAPRRPGLREDWWPARLSGRRRAETGAAGITPAAPRCVRAVFRLTPLRTAAWRRAGTPRRRRSSRARSCGSRPRPRTWW